MPPMRPNPPGCVPRPAPGSFAAVVAAATLAAAVLTLSGCKEAPPPATPEPAAPIVQGGQLRFPPGHPQLALLTTAVAAPPGRVTVELPARLVWNEERTQRIYGPPLPAG